MLARAGGGRPARLAVIFLAAWLVVGALARPALGDITYVYDELGRLVAVVDPASDTAVYAYDAVGNLLSIARHGSSSASVIDFQPRSGPVGSVVTVHGTGFSATPASNTVTFNGASATVSAATATSLVVSVPAGATTGTIGVTTPAGSATSGSAFTVTASSGAPTITSLTPAIGLPGAAVTVAGTNFEPIRTNNKLAFSGAPPARQVVTTATATALDVPVPPNARSGPISLATPAGTVVSAADFFVPVGGYTAAQVIFTGRLVLGGASVEVAMTSTNKQGLLLFEGVAGQRLNLGVVLLSGFGTPGVTVYRPDGAVLPTTAAPIARYLPPLPLSGLYVIALQNGNATHTVRLTLSTEVTATAEVGGSAVTVTIARVGQRARVSFAGTAGQRIDLGMTHALSGVMATFKTADEATTLASLGFGSPGELHSPVLPSSGTYLLMVEPEWTNTGNFTATLSQEVSGTITVDGASVPLSITRPGQRARVTFTGTSTQSLSLGLTSATVGGTVSVYRPGGATHLAPVSYSVPDTGVDLPNLAVAGTHEILVDPSGTGMGSLTLWVSQTLTATTALDGSAVGVSITRPGQRAVVTFPATAAQRASHVVSTTITGQMILLRPDGTVLATRSLPTAFVEPLVLSQTGTYTIIVDPGVVNTGSLTLASYNVPPDTTGGVTVNGATVPVTLSVPGQNAGLSFTAAAGATTIRGTGNSFGCVGIELSSGYGTTSCAASFNIGVTLAAGSYTVTINPQAAATGSVTIGVTQP